jgi:hypothetical protein
MSYKLSAAGKNMFSNISILHNLEYEIKRRNIERIELVSTDHLGKIIYISPWELDELFINMDMEEEVI